MTAATRRIVGVVVGVVTAGCTDTTDATVAPTLAPCDMPFFGETMCRQVADDGQPARLAAVTSFLYLDHHWGETVAISYAEPRGDESINCGPAIKECHRVVDQEVVDRMPVGTQFTIDFPDARPDRSWLTASGQGVRMTYDSLEATEEVAAQALALDGMATGYRLEIALTGSATAPLRLLAATPR